MKVTLKGMKELRSKLADVKPENIHAVVRHNGQQLQQNMMRKADFKKGYATGVTKRSIHLEIRDGGMTAEVGPETEYSPYLEYGTRFMQAQPFVGPALEEQKDKFIKDLERLVK